MGTCDSGYVGAYLPEWALYPNERQNAHLLTSVRVAGKKIGVFSGLLGGKMRCRHSGMEHRSESLAAEHG